MARLRRGAQSAFADDKSLRLRAAWLYHSYGLTQNEVAERLGLARGTVIRLLDEARRQGEVRVWIEAGDAELAQLGIELEQALGLDEAIVVPSAGGLEQISQAVGLALGRFLSETVAEDMTIGVGWGRTLTASLASFHPPCRGGIKVMSLLGGSVETRFTNPVEYAWRIAGALKAECYLFPAPLVVDSPETKRQLIEKCGLDRLYKLARSLDLVVVSAGDIGPNSTSLARHLITAREHRELVGAGCIGDVMCTFLDRKGAIVRHQVNERIMSVGLDALRRAQHKVIASGGSIRSKIIFAAIQNFGCNTLVTDEGAARGLLELAVAAGKAARKPARSTEKTVVDEGSPRTRSTEP